MKIIFTLLLLFMACVQSSFGDPTTFEEFKKLTKTERTALFANLNNPHLGTFFMWDWRMAMGEDSWQRRQLGRLTDAHGFTELDAFFVYYEQLRQEFWLDEGRKSKTTTPASDLPAASLQWKKDYDSADSQYLEALHLYAALAPTPQAQALNKRADDLLHVWTKEFPSGTNYSITPQRMATMEQEVQQIIEQLKTLPKLTSQEVQAGIEGLPIDHMR